MRKQICIAALAAVVAWTWIPANAVAQKINCANEYRSGKLYFSQYKDAHRKESPGGSRENLSETTTTLLDKAVKHFAVAVEHCPLDEAEYRWNNAIALGEAGLVEFADATVAADAEAKSAHLDKALGFVQAAVGEFAAVPETENGHKKKQVKKVVENRKYFWTELYNHGLDRAKQEDLELAAKYMEAAIIMNPDDPRTYHQGAIISFNAGLKAQAADMVQQALDLELDPDDKDTGELMAKLQELQLSLYNELGREALNEAKEENNTEKLDKALEYYDALVEAEPENPNHRYARGVAHMSGGKLYEDADAAVGADHYRSAAMDLEKAAEIVTVDKDRGFHVSATRAAMFAWRDAGDEAKALELNRRYACLDPMNAAAWRGLARLYVDSGNQDGALGALMMSKSLEGIDVPVESAVTNATDDAKAALAELGNPSAVKSYTDGESSITTYIWEDAKTARHYVLGKVQQEVTWCD